MQKCRAAYARILAYAARHLNYLLHFIFFQHLLQRIFPLDAGKMEHPRPLEQRLHVLAGAHARFNPVSYTHLDVYKRQVFSAGLAQLLGGAGVGDDHLGQLNAARLP